MGQEQLDLTSLQENNSGYNLGYWLGGRTSAADSRESARTPPGSARIRRTSAKNIFRRTPPNVRRTFGGHRRTPRGYGRIRADSAANWRKSSLEKCPPTKTSLTPRFPAEKLPPRTSFRRGNNSKVRVIGLGLGLWYSNPNPNLNPNPNHNPNLNPNPNPNPNPDPINISAADGRPPRKFFREEQRCKISFCRRTFFE